MNRETHFLNKWVLVAAGLFFVLLFVMAGQVPLNYWHHSKFSFAQDFVLNEFFPLITIFGKILGGSQSPVNHNNFQIYSYLSAAFLGLSCWLLFAVVAKLKGSKAIVISVVVLLTQVNFLWWGVIALNLSISTLGAVLFVVLITHTIEKVWLNFLGFFTAFFLLLGGSILAWALLPALLLAAFLKKKNRVAVPIALVLACGVIYLVNTNLFYNFTMYFQNAKNGVFALNGIIYRGKELGFAYGFWALIRNFNLALILLALLATFALKRIKMLGSLVLIPFVGLGLVLVLPLLAGISGISAFLVMPPLVVLSIYGYEFISQKFDKIALPITLILIVVLGFKGITAWFGFSPYQYYQSLFPFESKGVAIAEGEGEYLNMAGLNLLNSVVGKATKGDTIATNFYHNSAKEGVTFVGGDFLKRDLKNYANSVFVRLGLPSDLQKSNVFPPKNVIDKKVVNGFTLAIHTKPNKSVKKAFKLYNDNKLGESIVEFKALTDTFSNEPILYYGLARAQFDFNVWDDALSTALVGEQINPYDYKLKTLIGEVYRKQNKNKKAIKYFNKSTLIYKAYGRNHWMMGEYYLRLDSLEKAKGYFINAKYCPEPMAYRAEKSLQLIDSLQKVDKFKIGLAPYFINRINSFVEINDTSILRLKRLIKQMDFYIDLDSTNAQLRAHQGVGYMMLQNFTKAAIKFEKALEINPNYPQIRQYMIIARSNWGASMMAKDSLDEAIFHFRYALDYSPDDENLKANLSVAYNQIADRAFNN
ncbi:MAG: tetratricopeptide repeat protein, partial [Bacteroidia bacterium]